MNSESKNKWQIRIATLSIFLLGVLGGALALNAYQIWSNASEGTSKQRRYDKIFSQLDLTDEQRNEVQKIVGETREELQKIRQESDLRVNEIRGRANERFQHVLTPEQWQQFQKLKEDLRQKDKRH